MSAWLVGLGMASSGEDPRPWLRDPKEAKYLSLQDSLAVIAAGRAAAGRSLDPERTALHIAVGHLPFDLADIAKVLDASLDEHGDFSLSRFTSAGWMRARPLLAFKCLPNMAAYHVAASLGLSGPCSVGYPEPSQLHLALQDALSAMEEGRLDAAVLCGVAAQRNWLVEHHFARLTPPIEAERLEDAAGCLLLSSRPEGALARLLREETVYEPLSPSGPCGEPSERPIARRLRGPAALPLALREHLSSGAPWPFRHEVTGLDGVRCETLWGAP